LDASLLSAENFITTAGEALAKNEPQLMSTSENVHYLEYIAHGLTKLLDPK
jgi:hypothetical protein